MNQNAKAATVLLVDDDDTFREALFRLLQREGFSVIQAQTSTQALKEFREHQSEIDFVILDIVMPGMFGDEVAAKILSFRPESKIIFMSGNSNASVASEIALREGKNFIRKPFAISELRDLINACSC